VKSWPDGELETGLNAKH
jgi:putative transposase